MRTKDLDNFETIKNLFNEAMPEVPKCLDESVIEHKILSKQAHRTIQFEEKRNYFKPVAAIAACFILIFSVIFAANANLLSSDKVAVFNNYDDVNSKIATLEKELYGIGGSGGGPLKTVLYKQEDGVKMPDDIITDGEYFYYAYYDSYTNINRNKVYIYKADTTELVTVIDHLAPDATEEYDDQYEIRDLFVTDNRLTIIISKKNPMATDKYKRDFNATIAKIYDITDKSNPTPVSEFEQSGEYTSSRMIDNNLYIASYFSIAADNKEYTIPKITHGYESTFVSPKNIACFKNTKKAQYAVISTTDVVTGTHPSDLTAVLGGSPKIDCTKDYMYISEYSKGEEYTITTSRNNCNAMKLNLKNNKISFASPEEISKYINNTVHIDKEESWSGTAYQIGENFISILEDVNTNKQEITLYDEDMNILDTISFQSNIATSFASLNINNENGIFTIPAYWANDTRRYYGAITFKIENNHIVITNEFKNEEDFFVNQSKCIAVGDQIYVVFEIQNDASDNQKLSIYSYKY